MLKSQRVAAIMLAATFTLIYPTQSPAQAMTPKTQTAGGTAQDSVEISIARNQFFQLSETLLWQLTSHRLTQQQMNASTEDPETPYTDALLAAWDKREDQILLLEQQLERLVTLSAERHPTSSEPLKKALMQFLKSHAELERDRDREIRASTLPFAESKWDGSYQRQATRSLRRSIDDLFVLRDHVRLAFPDGTPEDNALTELRFRFAQILDIESDRLGTIAAMLRRGTTLRPAQETYLMAREYVLNSVETDMKTILASGLAPLKSMGGDQMFRRYQAAQDQTEEVIFGLLDKSAMARMDSGDPIADVDYGVSPAELLKWHGVARQMAHNLLLRLAKLANDHSRATGG